MLAINPSLRNLGRLQGIRLIVLLLQSLALTWALHLNQPLALGPILVGVGINALALAVTQWRLRQGAPVTDQVFALQLAVDVLALTLVLYGSGGATNPFVSYYLVPICVASAILPRALAWPLNATALGAYTTLLFFYDPLPLLAPGHAHHQGAFNPHTLGMWGNFMLSALLVSVFVDRMAHALRERQTELARARERQMRDEQLVGLATLAAGTAHELGTPLASIAVLAEDIEDALSGHPASEDIRLLAQQVRHCKGILQRLGDTAARLQRDETELVDVDGYLRTVLDGWRLLHPDRRINFHSEVAARTRIQTDATLPQALLNLLDNAAQASRDDIDVTLHALPGTVRLSIRDHGPGIPAALSDSLGQPFVSSKGEGRGLGVFLANASLERLGGRLAMRNHPEGGALTEVELPVSP